MKFISNIIQLVCLMILGIAVSAVAWVNAEVAMVIILIGCYVIGRKGIRQ